MAKISDVGLSSERKGGNASGGRRFNRATATGGLPKVLVVPLCEDETYRSDGTTTYLSDLYDIAEIRNLGPMIKQLRVHWVAENATANLRGRVTLAWSVLGRTWSTPVEVLAPQTGTQTGVIGAWYTNDGNFGLQIRFAVEVSNAAGAAVESARVSAFLEIELKS